MTRPDEPHVHTGECLRVLSPGQLELICGQPGSWFESLETRADKQLFSDADDVDLYLDMERGK